MEGMTRQLRVLRAAVFTALCVTLSAASHILLSGAPLPLATVASLSAVVFALAYGLAGRERGYVGIATLLVPLELAADTVFTTGQHACYGQAGGPVAGPLRSMGVDLLCRGGDWGTPLAQVAAPAGQSASGSLPTAVPWLLLVAHLAVGLLAAAWLWRGERALGRVFRALAALAFRPVLLVIGRVHARARVPAGVRRRARRASTGLALPLLSHSVVRRGPPRSPGLSG